jgi:hypothetical protein
VIAFDARLMTLGARLPRRARDVESRTTASRVNIPTASPRTHA